MPYRKVTLRKMPPKTRKFAKLIGELDSVRLRLKNILPVIEDLEMWERAEQKRRKYYQKERDEDDGKEALCQKLLTKH